jgi:cell division protein FtsB
MAPMNDPGAMGPDSPHEAAAPSPIVPRVRRRLRTAEETRIRRRRLITNALLISSFVFMVNALVGENGYLANLRARREYDTLVASIRRLRVENQQLLEQARRLRTDPAALEEAARRDLGLGRPGEVLVIIRDVKAPPASPPK